MTTSSSDLIAYRNQIFNFLMSCTIKNNWLANAHNDTLINAGHVVDESDPTTWKYYMNLQGNYHPTDEVMTVVSRDTQTEINFTKANLALHPRTAAVYRPGNPSYDRLCRRYPQHTDLIKNIIFPVPGNIESIIEAEDITLLHWGTGFLEADEVQTVVYDIDFFLGFIYQRWYMEWLSYEPFYRPLFWASLWQHLVTMVSVTRVKNIHTAHVSNFHVWEHLTSLGIGDYRDVLTRRQAMYLYRNMRYILKNRGRHDNLILLVNQLLTEQNVAMVNKVIHQQTVDGEDECRWIPEFVAEPIQTTYANTVRQQPPETVADITYQIANIGLEYDTSLEDIDRMTRILGGTRANRLPTKLLEIQPTLQDRKYAELLNNFVLDNIVYNIQNDRYQTTIVIQDDQTGVTLRLTTQDALILMHYATWRARDEIPTDLPSIYSPLVGTYKPGLNVDMLPKTINIRGDIYSTSSYVSADYFIEGAVPRDNYISADEFSQHIGVMFGTLIRQIMTLRYDAYEPSVVATREMMHASMNRAPFNLTLSTHTTYADWLSDPGLVGVPELVAAYDALSAAPDLYAALASRLIENLVPTDSESISPYLDALEDSEFYGRLKELFVQLCSYNVLFLDTQRDRQVWALFPRIITNNAYVDMSHSIEEQLTFVYDTNAIAHRSEGDFPVYVDIDQVDGMTMSTVQDTDLSGIKTTASVVAKSVPTVDPKIAIEGTQIPRKTNVTVNFGYSINSTN